MPRPYRTLWLLIAVLAASVAACGGIGTVIMRREPLARETALMEARARWDASGFVAYRMQLSDRGCRLEVDVRAERVISTRYAQLRACDQQPVAVRDLFALIERDGAVRRACVYRGCACDDVLNVRAEYHPSLGYPRSLEISLTPTPNWRHADFWRAAWRFRSLDVCDDLAIGSRMLTVVDVTPIQ